MMKPRLKTSIRWTQLPKEYHLELVELFLEEYSIRLPKGEFIVESWIYQEEFILRLGFLEHSRIVQANFEVSVDFTPGKQESFKNALDLAIDSAEWMLEQWISQNQISDFPRTWKECDFEGQKIWLQYSTINSSLEKQADRLLGLESGLVGEFEIHDALDLADEKIFSNDDDDDEGFEDEYDDENESEASVNEYGDFDYSEDDLKFSEENSTTSEFNKKPPSYH